jgi:hypothetical protein
LSRNVPGAAEPVSIEGRRLLRTDSPLWLAAILVCFFILAGAWAATRMPICDEAFYGIPGRNLLLQGTTASPMIESAGTFLTRIERITYWEMPLQLFLQSWWYRLAGISIFSLRSLSVCFAGIGLISWFVVLKDWTENFRLALLATFLLSIDYGLLSTASVGRSDATSFGLGSASLAAFILLRNAHPSLGFFVSHALVVLAGLTHPVGGLVALCGVLYLQAPYLRGWKRVAIAVSPYLIGALLWGMYIRRDPVAFQHQFFGNSAGRLWPLIHPIRALRGEIEGRYLAAFGGILPFWAQKARLLILGYYTCGFVAALIFRKLPQAAGRRTLLRLFFLTSLILLFVEGAKQPWYLIYVMPYLCAFSAMLVIYSTPFRTIAIAATIGVVLLEVAGSCYTIWLNPYRNRYEPVVKFLKASAHGELVIGPAELNLEVPNVVQDMNFGRLSGKVPSFVVIPDSSGDSERGMLEASGGNQQNVQWVKQMLSRDYILVVDRVPFRIFQRAAPRKAG